MPSKQRVLMVWLSGSSRPALQSKEPIMTPPQMTRDVATRPEQPPQPANPAGRIFLVAIVVIAAAMAVAFASNAFSQGFGPPWQSRPFWGQTFDPAAFEDRADRMVRHLSIEVDATAEQQDRLRTIVRSAVRDLVPLREKAVNSRQRGRDLLTQTTIDRAAIESLRVDQMALADQASRRVAQAIADAASVLTVEQRRKIAERFDAMQAYRRGWHRG
jgi:periplasmic protein CpxP/Spy